MNHYPDLFTVSQGPLNSIYVPVALILETPISLSFYRRIRPEPQLS
jgi:hypothetical protein